MAAAAGHLRTHRVGQAVQPVALRFRRALEQYDRMLGPEDPRLAPVLRAYAAVLREVGRGEEAEQMERRLQSLPG